MYTLIVPQLLMLCYIYTGSTSAMLTYPLIVPQLLMLCYVHTDCTSAIDPALAGGKRGDCDAACLSFITTPTVLGALSLCWYEVYFLLSLLALLVQKCK